MTLFFKNPGEADIRALTTLGVNVKIGDNAIGMFGTGTKMAAAGILRGGGSFIVYSGLDRYEFIRKKETIRGQVQEMVHLLKPDGTSYPLGFTTHLAVNWKAWQFYRELRSNQQDEGGGKPTTAYTEPAEGITLIVVEHPGVEEAHRNADEYFIGTKPLLSLDGLELHPADPDKPENHLFYRGIQVSQTRKPGIYRYNITSPVALTEDRTLAAPYAVESVMSRAIGNCEDETIIEKLLTCTTDHWEADLNYGGLLSCSETFLDVAERIIRQKPMFYNLSLRPLLHRMRNVDPYEWVDPSLTEAKMLEKAEKVCRDLGYEPQCYEIRIVDNLGNGVLGEAKGGIVYLSKRVFTMGTKMVTGTLMEEIIHLRYGYQDCTRDLQNYLIDKLISLVEDKDGEPL